MLDRSLVAEFESYRKILSTDETRRTFDERIERLLSQHGVDYVRGYVDALKDASSPTRSGEELRAGLHDLPLFLTSGFCASAADLSGG
jgi:hypothetical protein